MRAIIFDLDGTLADNEHRQHLVRGDSHQWDEFFSGIKDDIPNQPIKEMYDVLRSSGRYACILVSGRPDTYREVTEKWLGQYGIGYDLLCMRKVDDRRPDYQIKKDILADLRSKGYEILLAVDDRTATVRMWRENGVMCLQCADHDY
jgi:FMN phosphatase YigB (HAD superfamily)